MPLKTSLKTFHVNKFSIISQPFGTMYGNLEIFTERGTTHKYTTAHYIQEENMFKGHNFNLFHMICHTRDLLQKCSQKTKNTFS